jgi:hypothetical protein
VTERFSRRSLIAVGSLFPFALVVRPAGAAQPISPTVPASFPRQDPARVSEVVGASHRDLDRVRALVEETPALANAGWDWGFGDWETALGAAAHTGRREIAEYLLSRGARLDVFAAAMLGRLAIVRAAVEADPAVVRVAGPHGIPLVAHARAGGDAAAEVLRYLESLPQEPVETVAAPTAEQRRGYLGRYRFGEGAGDVLEVGERDEKVTLRRGEEFARFLVPDGPHLFHPVGAPAVRIAFAVTGAAAVAVTIHDGALVVTGTRIAEVAAPVTD